MIDLRIRNASVLVCWCYVVLCWFLPGATNSLLALDSAMFGYVLRCGLVCGGWAGAYGVLLTMARRFSVWFLSSLDLPHPSSPFFFSNSGLFVSPFLQHPMVFSGFDHLKWYVGNAKQAADWYVVHFGFRHVAYRGLETGQRKIVSHVIAQNDVVWEFISSYTPDAADVINQHVALHGDGVKDVALRVDNARLAYEFATSRGAVSVSAPEELTDENGTVVIATIQTYGDTVHTFVQRDGYKGIYMPGYKSTTTESPFANFTPAVGITFMDHVVGNQPEDCMLPVVEWYEAALSFHRFWSVDDKTVHTEFSSLRSIVMADDTEKVKLPINEPAAGKRKSQIQEYVDYYGGPGVQHIAIRTDDILHTIKQLKARGVTFLSVPKAYYTNLWEKLKTSPTKVKEDVATIEELNILVDYDDKGYLLQLFTQPCQDRPTVFIEIIQRNGHNGFGAGNFRSLFEAIEREQAARGNL